MTRVDAPAFSTLLAGLAEVFAVTLTATRTELYFRALEDLPLTAVQEAAVRAMRECRFFPKPAEIREFAGADEEERAEMAWLALLEAFHHGGGYDGCELPDDDITVALVRVYWGGAERAREWWRFCHDAALDAKHREFVARYQTYATRPRHELPRLPGAGFLSMLEEGRERRALEADPGPGDA
ncbi:MAG TPA: hypothetical protein VJ301_11745 [Propionibacteriaceae bacterium]|nr:hypothetical protein [Propionibacteriaceae bacterium]